MKKILLSAAAIAMAATASAEVTAFIAENGVKEGWDREANEYIVLPNGFYFQSMRTGPTYTNPAQYIEQYAASKYVSIQGGAIKGGDKDGKPGEIYVTSGAIRWFENNPITFTPAKGVKITEIHVRNQTNKVSQTGLIHPNAVREADAGTTQQWYTHNADGSVTLIPEVESRVFYIDITTEGQPNDEQVALPVIEADFFVDPGYKDELAFAGKTHILSADKYITLSTATEGADIYYTIDGTEPTTASTKYTAPFRLDKDAVVKAIAVKEGKEDSFKLCHEVFVVAPGSEMYVFNFNNYPSLVTEQGQTFGETKGDVPTGCNGYLYYNHGDDYSVEGWYGNSRIEMPGVELVNEVGGKMVLNIKGSAHNVLERSGAFGFVVEFRSAPHQTYNGEWNLFLDDPDLYMTDIVIAGGRLYSAAGNPRLIEGQPGEYKICDFTGGYSAWRCGDAKVEELKFNPNPGTSSANYYYDQVYVFSDKKVGGVSNIVVEDENAPVEYYNLQGVRVANPENGLYIRRQGNKATKVLVK